MKLIFLSAIFLLSACSLQNQTDPTATLQTQAHTAAFAPFNPATNAPTATRTQTNTATPTRTASTTRTGTPTATATPTKRPTRDIFKMDAVLGNSRNLPRQAILNLAVPAPGTISPALFSINYWKGIFNRPIRRALAPLNFTVMRWGGENYQETQINLKDLDRFIEDCRKANVEPLIQVPFWNRTPESAAAIVQYVNVVKKYDVHFWSIGNEPDKNLRAGSRDAYIQGFRAFHDAMKAVDPRIMLFGPELATEYDWNNPAQDWLTPFLQANGDIVDVVSLHRYPYGGTVWRTDIVMRDALHTADRVNALRAHIRNVTGRDIPLAFTEMNLSHDWSMGGEGSGAGFVASMWLAETLGEMADSGVAMVNVWNAHSDDSLGLVESRTLVRRPTFYALRLFANYGDRIVPLASHVPNVSAHASLDLRTNKTVVVLVNRGTAASDFEIVFNSNEEQKDGGIYMDRGSLARLNFSMPAESIASLTLNANFQVTQSIVYSRAMFQNKKGAKITNVR